MKRGCRRPGMRAAAVLVTMLASAAAAAQARPEPLTRASLTGTAAGRAIHDYLRCVDADCQSKLQAVLESTPESVPLLARLLRHGVTPEVGAGLPGDAALLVPIRAVHALGAAGSREAIAAMIGALDNPQPLVRAAAVDALAGPGGERAFDAVVGRLGDTDMLVRERAAMTLARLRRAGALPALRAAAKAETMPHVRAAIDEAIRSLESR